jgi:putative transposase
MSRLRRLVLSDRYFFVTCKVLPERERLSEVEFALLADSIQLRRAQHHFLLTAWVFLPDHWHAIVMPPHPSTISQVMESIKVSSTRQINKLRGEGGVLWQGRFFDRALRTIKEYHEKVEYIHLNPVKRGLVTELEGWRWSSIHDYTGTLRPPAATNGVLPVDRILLPADEKTRV